VDTAATIHSYLEEQTSPSSRGIRLTADTLLLEEKVIDSMGMLALILFVEDTFDIEVPEEDMMPSNFGTIDDLAAYVDRRLQSVR
jgi:acyl carrier protein